MSFSYCIAQSDSSNVLNSFSEKPPSYKGISAANIWVTYFNDFEFNPATTAYYTKLNLNVNRQFSFMGKYYLTDALNGRINWKLKQAFGFSLRYEHESKGLTVWQTAALALNWRVGIGKR
jgi:hypothetical protein